MQLIDTHVSANDDHTTTVVFAGEGNEEVCVRLSADGLRDEDAVLRAKALMVQLTRFEERPSEATSGEALDVGEGASASFASQTGLEGDMPPSSTGRLFQNGDTDRDG